MQSWLEISLTVDGELAEAVSEVLARFAPDGVAVESTAIATDPETNQGFTVGSLRVAAYLPVDQELEEKRQKIEEALWYLGRIQPVPPIQEKFIYETDWSESWKQHYHPILIGKKLVIVPAWLENPNYERIPIRIDPGMAFGTGTHPTTQLCMEFLEEYLTAESPTKSSIIDIGCGSGILTITGIKLGAELALGVDIDPEALQSSLENAEINSVSDSVEFGLGSLELIRTGSFSISKAGLVLANILAPILVQMLNSGLGDTLLPGGKLVLSGILNEQSEEVVKTARSNRLNLINRKQSGDWVALVFAQQ